MKTIELTHVNRLLTSIVIDKIFEIRMESPYSSTIVSVNGAKTEVLGSPESITKDINEMA
jgi:hypothetical protein